MRSALLILLALLVAPAPAYCASCRKSYCYTDQMCGQHCECKFQGKDVKGVCFTR